MRRSHEQAPRFLDREILTFIMSKSFNSSIPADIRLLLRADAEQHWLHREVIPVLRHLEARERLPEEQVGAALAYLEAMWNEAMMRARETDAAHAHLNARTHQPDPLSGPAGRYHDAVRVLRGVLAERVTPLMECPSETDGAYAPRAGLRITDARSDSDDCPRAA